MKTSSFVFCLLAIFPSTLITKDPPQPSIRILNSSGRRILTIFEGLRPSSPAVPSYLTAALHCSDREVTRGDAFPRTKGRRLLVQSGCGGHYAACIEDFCKTDCEYLFCWSGGSNYNSGWKTHYWNGCCYTDVLC